MQSALVEIETQEQGEVGKLVQKILGLACVEFAGLGPKSRNDVERNIGVLGKDAKLAEPRLSPFIQEVEAHADRTGNRLGAVRLVARVERYQALAIEPLVDFDNRPFQRLLL